DTALEKRELVANASYDSAAVGACCARIALADASDAGDRSGLLDEAAKALERARSKDDVDVVCAAATLAFARGDYAGCEARLKEASASLGNAGRGALASYYWMKGLLALMNKDPAALGHLERASILRPSTQCGHAFAMALRLNVRDDSVKDPKALAEKLQGLQDLFNEHVKAGLRWGIDKDEEAATWNAIGVAWTRAYDTEKALNALRRAQAGRRDLLLYAINVAMAGYASMPPDATDQTKKRVWAETAGFLHGTVQEYANKRDPTKLPEAVLAYCRDVMLSAIGLYNMAGNYGEARIPLGYLHDRLGFDDKEYFRTTGALADWSHRLDLATPPYKEAIKLGHKDSYKMQERIDLWERKR
ncbi:MAG TPA: hypothetical protein VFF73_12465, partial [Planctomycetota bacterium]|nr:hypothetical protein [Planctomycetota bacterium]